MLENLMPRESLIGFARKQARPTIRKTVRPADVEQHLADGWSVYRKGRKSVGLERPKKKADHLESRVWTLMYRMGFLDLSGPSGARIRVGPQTDAPTSQLDIVAVDDEVALCVECKSFESPKREQNFAEKVARLAGLKKRFSEAIGKAKSGRKRRHAGLVMFLWDVITSENDTLRADAEGVIVFDNHDLEYFEALVRLLGPAARFQFLAEVFEGKQISGLEVRVPALKTRMGARNCYTFAIRPDYLLKIAYVAHRAKGKSIDIDTYQRMLSKSRLRDIAAFIAENGIFPTNIVVNIENPRYVRFDRGKQEGDDSGAQFGWLTITAAYGIAWIIDGQHRLYAFSGHDRAATSFLNVLAFEGLSPPRQAQLFVDVNSEQRRVKRSLLIELDAALKWEAEEIEKRIDAIISKAGMALDQEVDSPLRHRVLLSDVKRTDLRCVSLTALAAALNKPDFFVISQKKDITEYGPLWRDDPLECLKRTFFVVKGWLSEIASAAQDWWNIGAGEGGGLAMNNGVTVCINILRSTLEQLQSPRFVTLDSEDLLERLRPYARSLGGYFARMNTEERLRFRQLQGIDGQNTGTRMAQEAIRKEIATFNPSGLDEWIRTKDANTNDEGRRVIDEIEQTLQQLVLSTLKEEFDSDAEQWWFEGVPKNVRKKIDERINESDGKAGSREQNFDIVHYREILRQNWSIFGSILSYGPASSSKDAKTQWIVDVSEMRNVVMHPSRREYLSFDKLNALRQYRDWLVLQVRKYDEVVSDVAPTTS